MKKLLLIIALLLSVATLSAQSYRETGSKWIVSGAYNPLTEGGGDWLYKGTGLNISCGWQFNPHWYLGGSTGYYIYHESAIPLMVDARWYWFDAKHTPFMGLRTGFCIEHSLEPGIFGRLTGRFGWLTTSELGYAFGNLTVSIWCTNYLYQEPKDQRYIYAGQLFLDIMPMFSLGWEF